MSVQPRRWLKLNSFGEIIHSFINSPQRGQNLRIQNMLSRKAPMFILMLPTLTAQCHFSTHYSQLGSLSTVTVAPELRVELTIPMPGHTNLCPVRGGWGALYLQLLPYTVPTCVYQCYSSINRTFFLWLVFIFQVSLLYMYKDVKINLITLNIRTNNTDYSPPWSLTLFSVVARAKWQFLGPQVLCQALTPQPHCSAGRTASENLFGKVFRKCDNTETVQDVKADKKTLENPR